MGRFVPAVFPNLSYMNVRVLTRIELSVFVCVYVVVGGGRAMAGCHHADSPGSEPGSPVQTHSPGLAHHALLYRHGNP